MQADIDLNGYAHALRDNDIRHIRNSHGENTQEKYPVTKQDIKNIPWIVENYDKVYTIKRNDGRTGIMYVKVNDQGTVYYLEQVTSKYGNEPLLVNKQMIKTGIDDIPDLPGLIDAITKKQSETEFLNDLKKAQQVYAQSVYQSHSINKVTQPGADVKQQFSLSSSENVKAAEQHFGTTYKISEAGYLLTDGNLLDFSGRHEGAPGGYRTVDHRDITDALDEDYGGDNYSDGMIRFMGEGNIRLSPESGGINLSVKPNKAQLSTLDRYISNFRGEVILDIDDANGNTVVSIEYPKRTYSKRIINDINAYFDEGKIPEQPSDLGQFRYSLSKKDFSIAPPVGADVHGKDIGYDIAPPVPESVLRANKARPKIGDPAYAPIAEEYVKQANTDDRMQDVTAIVGDKDTFLSKKAMELYQEISGLSKGVRASKRLGYILDHGYDWKSIKTALLNIRDNPGQVVNPNSAAESVAREMLGREYDELVQELSEQNETMDTYVTKMRNIQRELTNNERLRAEARADYDGEIERLQAEYDGKKNKTTKAANNLLRRIERLSRMRDNVDADYAKRISNLEERLAKIDAPEYRRAAQRKSKQAEYTSLMKELVGDTSTWVDKKMGLSYKVNTLRRNLRDVVRDASGKRDIARADAIYDELQGKYNHNEAELKRESRRIKAVFAELNLNHAEDTYAHMLGEFQYNPQSLLTEEVVKEFYEKNKGRIDTDKVDTAIAEARKTFDELIVRVNDRLKEQGMKEIPYRQGYFPHFHQPKQGLLARLLNWKTVDTEIPTSIAGLTETFNPERSWQSFNKERKTDNTDYSLAQGLDTYIHGALDWIYHIEDIQKRRALENYIRYIHSDEGIKARVDAIIDSEELDADEVQQQIDAVYAEANNPLNNFVTNLRAGTNTLANKKSEDDRKWESDTNRKIYSVMTNLNNRINANMVVGSLSSALTNFIPITQSWVEVSPAYSLKGMRDTIKSTIRDDGVVNKSDFLTNRLLSEENLYRTGWDKISDKAAFMMEAIDNFTSQTVWRSKYLQNIAEGMSEAQAIKNADQFAENVIAGRSRGNQPTIFDAKNPFTKIFTAFQLEVSNQYGYMFKDAPQDAATKGRLIKGYATAFLGAYVYNALYSSLVGRDAAFDPISIFEDLFRDLGLFGDDEEEEPADVILNLTDNILDEVPFVGGLTGGGRIPISSALPYSGEYGGLKGFLTDISKGDGESLMKEMLKPLYYLALPMGGGQIKKTAEGVGMYLGDHPVAGSYTDNGALRFPVGTTAGDVAQAAVFGQYASENARDYFDNDRSPLKTRQIHAFMCADMSIQDYWTYREGLSAIEADKDVDGKAISGSKKEKVIKYIEDLDISDDAKHILLKYEYPGDDTYNYEIIDYLNSRTDISYTEIKAILEELGFTVDNKGNITWD